MTDTEMRRTQRRVLMKGLGTDALTSYVPFMTSTVDSALEEWAAKGNVELKQDGGSWGLGWLANGLAGDVEEGVCDG
jgi:hypothetical protein